MQQGRVGGGGRLAGAVPDRGSSRQAEKDGPVRGRKPPSAFEHPVALGSLRSWLRVLAASGGVDRPYVPRAAAVALTTLLTSPLRLYETLRYGRAVERTHIHPSPVFILGHWRTGTTHLHNMLCHDPQFGYISTFQALAPGFCLMGEKVIKPLLAWKTARDHPTREIDNMPLSLDGPQEEAFALANMTPCASLHLYSLPRRAEEIFDKYALLENLSPEELAEWKQAYLTLLRKATLRSGGKRLVLKDPANSGRLSTILELFPDARFIHICRDPYRILPSMVGVYRVVLPRSQLQRITLEEVEGLVLRFYAKLMRKYLRDRSLIAPGNLVEVRFEDLEQRPLEELSRVYDTLGLPGFAAAEPRVRAYLDSMRGFRKNPYRVDDDVIRKVNRHWGFALEAWGYRRLEPGSSGGQRG